MNYNLEDLFQSITDVFEQVDEGKIEPSEANEIARRCCEAYLASHEEATQ